jgi:hypothetical protein
MSTRKLIVGAAAAACLLAAGCVVRARPGEVVVAEGPPVPIVEVEPAPPVTIVDPFWIAGWWGWEGRWVWHPGYWTHRPRPGAVWVPHAWVRDPHGWVHSGGHWR